MTARQFCNHETRVTSVERVEDHGALLPAQDPARRYLETCPAKPGDEIAPCKAPAVAEHGELDAREEKIVGEIFEKEVMVKMVGRLAVQPCCQAGPVHRPSDGIQSPARSAAISPSMHACFPPDSPNGAWPGAKARIPADLNRLSVPRSDPVATRAARAGDTPQRQRG
jgi:hypothetical protein